MRQICICFTSFHSTFHLRVGVEKLKLMMGLVFASVGEMELESGRSKLGFKIM